MPARFLAGLVVAGIFSALAVAAPADREAAAALAERAQTLAAAGDLPDAIATLERAEAESPDWPELKVNLAALRSRSGDYEGAIRAARAALELTPELDAARFNLGLAQLKSGDPGAAAATLERYRGRADAPASVRVALGLAYVAQHRAAEAAAELGAAAAAGIRDPGVLYALARARRDAGDRDGAESARGLLAASAPGSAALEMLTGDALDAARDWVAAEAAYRRAIAADDRFPGAHHSLGLMLYKRRAYDEAARAFDAELQRQPRYAPALYYRALLELDRGRAREAIPQLEAAVAAVPSMVEGWRDLGRARLDAGLPGPAAEALRTAITLDGDDPRAFYLLSRALTRAGEPRAAAEALRRASELNRRHREGLQDKVSGEGPGG